MKNALLSTIENQKTDERLEMKHMPKELNKMSLKNYYVKQRGKSYAIICVMNGSTVVSFANETDANHECALMNGGASADNAPVQRGFVDADGCDLTQEKRD